MIMILVVTADKLSICRPKVGKSHEEPESNYEVKMLDYPTI